MMGTDRDDVSRRHRLTGWYRHGDATSSSCAASGCRRSKPRSWVTHERRKPARVCGRLWRACPAGPRIVPGAARPSCYPAPVLEPDCELIRNFISRRLGSALECIPTAHLAINLRPTNDDQAYRAPARNGHSGWHDGPWCFTPGRSKRAGPELTQALGSHQVAFDHRIQLRCSSAESDDETLDGVATFDRDKKSSHARDAARRR